MKLYRVHIDRVLYVVADDAMDAECKAVHMHPNPDETEVDVEPATQNGAEADGWLEFPPYGQPSGVMTKAKEFLKYAE